MVVCKFFILLFYISFMKIAHAQNTDCELDKDRDFPRFPPFIMETSSKNIVLPKKENGKRIIRVASKTSLAMSCNNRIGTTVKFNSFSNTNFPANLQDVLVKCNNGKLEYGSQNQGITMKDLGCVNKIRGAARYTTRTCGSLGQIIEIGFNSININSNNNEEFYTQMTVCFAVRSEVTLWTEHTLHGGNIDAKDTVPPPLNPNPTKKRKRNRPDFSSDISPFTPDIEYIYTIAAQRSLGSLKNLIMHPGEGYFARGHLAPAADFVTQPEMDATFAFTNVVPQWQQINNGNWGVIEKKIIKLAATRKSNMRIFTGRSGILKDISGKNIYLGDITSFSKGQKKVPIPEAIWKIVIDQTSKQGVAFFVSNNFAAPSPPVLSTNICSTLAWLGQLDTVNPEKGHTYCFTIGDFKTKYPKIFLALPGDIDDTAVLLM